MSRHQRPICRLSGGLPQEDCPLKSEWFRDGRAPSEPCSLHGPGGGADRPDAAPGQVRLVSPTSGLHLAKDPRIPDRLEVFPLRVESDRAVRKAEWILDGELVATSAGPSHLWPLVRGSHDLRARIWIGDAERPVETEKVDFLVK